MPASPKWDVYAAELADTARSSVKARPFHDCIYCGRPTRALSPVCGFHRDLPNLEADISMPDPYAIPWITRKLGANSVALQHKKS